MFDADGRSERCRVRYARIDSGPRLLDVNDSAVIARRLIELRTEHRDLDVLIGRLTSDQTLDQLAVTRMKKRKLRLKDEIAWYESRLIPDLDA